MYGRKSDAYAQLLYNRFLAKYRETASIKIKCNECAYFKVVRANSAPIYLENMHRYYVCEECEFSMDEEPDSQ